MGKVLEILGDEKALIEYYVKFCCVLKKKALFWGVQSINFDQSSWTIPPKNETAIDATPLFR